VNAAASGPCSFGNLLVNCQPTAFT